MLLTARVTDFTREKYSQVECMNNEWNRFQSFNEFPIDSIAMPLRLSQAGFYYTGVGEEVKCFCCGLVNSRWTEGESAIDVHRRLSPDCRFIRGEDTDNISIHAKNGIKGSAKALNKERGHDKVHVKSVSKQLLLDESDFKMETQSSFSIEATEDDRLKYGNHNNERQPHEQGCSSRSHTTQNERFELGAPKINGQIELYPRITNEKPKHTDYALKNARQASFADWPANHIIQASDLVDAGFYYAGLQDCVRCFFCSCGMKNWECGDNPWIEHARWSPGCAYVKLVTGNTHFNTSHTDMNDDNVPTVDEIQMIKENIPSDWLIETLNSVAAKLILGKGYSQVAIENAALLAREKYGREPKIQHIMEFILAANEEPTHRENHAAEENALSHHLATTADVKPSIDTQRQKDNKSSKELSSGSNRQNHIKSEKQILQEENQRLKDLTTCKICMDSDACVAFLPCGHLISCVECSRSLTSCAICRQEIRDRVRVYQA